MKTTNWIRLAAALVTALACFAAWWFWGRTDKSSTEPTVEEPTEIISSDTIELSEEKIQVAGLTTSPATATQLVHEHIVPGRLRYDDRRHIVLRTATDGIVTAMLVKPGQVVEAGDVVVELSSPEVGNARADALNSLSELKLATETLEWEKATCDGLRLLTEAIRRREAIDKIRQDFQSVTLGKSRELLLSAYSDLLLAEIQLDAAKENQRNGVISARTVDERVSGRDQYEAALMAALEEQSFRAGQECRRAESVVQDAERRLKISQQKVRTLLGSTESGVQTDLTSTESANLSLVQLRAPFRGTIEHCNFSGNERVEVGEPLLTLADTASLWVSADLRQREWRALALQPGDKIRVMTTLEGLENIEAAVHFAGREVDPATNAVPLVGVIANADGRLRPGMFVRVAIPVNEPRTALAVPESSVLEHEQKSFVFVPAGDRAFRRVDIEPGLRTGGFVEVLSGLTDGDSVIASGGFILKSEFLLQGESE